MDFKRNIKDRMDLSTLMDLFFSDQHRIVAAHLNTFNWNFKHQKKPCLFSMIRPNIITSTLNI